MMTPFRRCCCCCCCLARRRLLLKTPMLLVVVVVVISSASSFENNTNAQDNGEWSNELKRIERASDTFFFVVRFGGKSREQNFIRERFWLFRQPTNSSHFYTRESIFQLFTTLPHYTSLSQTLSHTKTDRERGTREGTRCCYLVVGIFINCCVVVRNRWGTATTLLWEVAKAEFFIVKIIINARRQPRAGKRQRA